MKIRPIYKPIEDISTASMADIAFLLIIFFMLTTVLSVRKGIEFKLPPDDEKSQEKKMINLVLDRDGTITIDDKPFDLAEVRPFLQQQMQLNPEKFVIIKCDDETSYARLIDVLDETKLARVKNIAIPTKPEMAKLDEQVTPQ